MLVFIWPVGYMTLYLYTWYSFYIMIADITSSSKLWNIYCSTGHSMGYIFSNMLRVFSLMFVAQDFFLHGFVKAHNLHLTDDYIRLVRSTRRKGGMLMISAMDFDNRCVKVLTYNWDVLSKWHARTWYGKYMCGSVQTTILFFQHGRVNKSRQGPYQRIQYQWAVSNPVSMFKYQC